MKKKRILIVDDEADLLEILQDLLEAEGFEVQTACTSDAFRLMVQNNLPDLIILDIMLGNENGAEVYSELTAGGLDSQIPGLFLTGLAGDRPSSLSGPGRCYAMLGKPFQIDELCREVHSLVNNAA